MTGGIVDSLRDGRRSGRNAKAGARLLRSEFEQLAEQLVLVESDRQWRIFYSFDIPSWDGYSDLLAGRLDSERWARVEAAVRVLRALEHGMKLLAQYGTPPSPIIPLGADAMVQIPESRERAREAYNALAKLVGGSEVRENFGAADAVRSPT